MIECWTPVQAYVLAGSWWALGALMGVGFMLRVSRPR